jgi:hypothetical protein
LIAASADNARENRNTLGRQAERVLLSKKLLLTRGADGGI